MVSYTNNFTTLLTETDITAEGNEGEGAAVCATKSKHTVDGNGNSETWECSLK